MQNLLADETGPIQPRDTNAVNAAQRAKRAAICHLGWQSQDPEAMLSA